MDIKEYLEKNGIMRKWFAEKIGMSQQQFCDYLNNRNLMPTIYWKIIVEVSHGKVKIEDLLERNNKYYEEHGRIPGKMWRKLPRITRQPKPKPKPKLVDDSDNQQLSKDKKTEQT